MPIPANLPMRLKVHFTYFDYDWSEVYYLFGTSSGDPLLAALQGRQILEYRRLWLADDVTMDYAAVSAIDTHKDGYAVDMTGIQGQGGVPSAVDVHSAPVNDPEVAIAYREETSATGPPSNLPGNFGTRLWGGIPDKWVTGNAWDQALLGYPPFAPLVGAIPAITYLPGLNSQGNLSLDNASYANLVNLRRAFLNVLMLNCGMLVKVGGPLTPRTTWRVNRYTRFVFRDISSHRRGKSWKDSVARAPKSY